MWNRVPSGIEFHTEPDKKMTNKKSKEKSRVNTAEIVLEGNKEQQERQFLINKNCLAFFFSLLA